MTSNWPALQVQPAASSIVARGRQALQKVPMLREDCIHRIHSSWMLFAIPAFDDTSNVTWPFGLIAGNFPHAEQATIDKSYSDVTCPAVTTVSRSTSPTQIFARLKVTRPLQCSMQPKHVQPILHSPITTLASFGTVLQSIKGTMQVTQFWTVPSQAIATAILVSHPPHRD